MNRRDLIANRFSQASATYDGASGLQALSAQYLAERVLGYDWADPDVLEVGCGTGGLTNRLIHRICGNWIVTDIAPAMLERARTLLPDVRATFCIMDGESPELAPGCLDLIVSNLAFQWFEDLPGALERLARCLARQGRLIVNTLGQCSLTEWRNAVASTGHQAGVPAYPAASELSAMLPGMRVDSQIIPVIHEDARAFLRSLKAIGATTPAREYLPIPAASLRQAMAKLGAPCQVSYEILTLDWMKSEA
jgi:malonyl-CoA O-methyltransferase